METAKLSIVDLAGSERNKNTHATGLFCTLFDSANGVVINSVIGDRMDEANKINNSLMALGQCMRTLRCNQMKLAKAKSSGTLSTMLKPMGSSDRVGMAGSTRPVRLEVPMYRTSKLTELFQEFFEGHGRAVEWPASLTLLSC